MVSTEAKAEVARVNEVTQHAFGMPEDGRVREGHGSAEHADGVGDVGARVGSAIEEGADERLIFFKELSVGDGSGAEGVGDVLDDFGAGGRADSLGGEAFSIGG